METRVSSAGTENSFIIIIKGNSSLRYELWPGNYYRCC